MVMRLLAILLLGMEDMVKVRFFLEENGCVALMWKVKTEHMAMANLILQWPMTAMAMKTINWLANVAYKLVMTIVCTWDNWKSHLHFNIE